VPKKIEVKDEQRIGLVAQKAAAVLRYPQRDVVMAQIFLASS
jgi:hypothetical protein